MTDPDRMETRTDVLVPAREVTKLPVISAEAYSHVGRFGGALVLACFEQMGGLPRMAAWADQNPTDFYTKLFPKVVARSQQVDISGSLTIDDAITKLEGQSVDAEFREAGEPAEFYDL